MSIRNPDLASLALRIGFGAYMAWGHGFGKLQKLFSGTEIRFPELFGMSSEISLALAVFSEFICCLFIIIGYKTRAFCIPLIITMAIAAFYIHGSDPWFMKSADGGSKEPAMLYLFGFLSIYFLGPGKYSIDDRYSHGII